MIEFKEDDRERDFHHFVVLLHAFGHFCELATLERVGDDLQVFARRIADHDIELQAEDVLLWRSRNQGLELGLKELQLAFVASVATLDGAGLVACAVDVFFLLLRAVAHALEACHEATEHKELKARPFIFSAVKCCHGCQIWMFLCSFDAYGSLFCCRLTTEADLYTDCLGVAHRHEPEVYL